MPQPPDRGEATEEDSGRSSGAPRWVKVFGIIAVALLIVLLILLLAGGHGPGRHL